MPARKTVCRSGGAEDGAGHVEIQDPSEPRDVKG